MDAYRSGNSIVLWIKTPEGDLRIEKKFKTYIYIEYCDEAKQFLVSNQLPLYLQLRRNFLRKWVKVYAVPVPNLSFFERFVRWIERETKYRIPLYNADIVPEQLFLYKYGLTPCSAIDIDGEKIVPINEGAVPFTNLDVKVVASVESVKAIIVNGRKIEGDEAEVLGNFVAEFEQRNPDVLQVERAFSMLPFLVARLEAYGLICNFHRWDYEPLIHKGGKSYYSYGKVRYQDYSLRLHGRFLIDSASVFGSECAAEAVAELSQLTGLCFQQLAARSFGAAFQGALVREMVRNNILVPFKDKPVDRPISMLDMVKSDRAGHTFDPLVGFHRNVAEIDFCSMFPWLIYNHNISADTILSDDGPFESVPGVPVRISLVRKGLVPETIKPLIDRRMEYKRNPTTVNKMKAVGLKWVLVTSYGYLRFREFKLGIATSHAAICAYARETLLAAGRLAEEHGYELVHGIVDSLFIKKNGSSPESVKEFCKELEVMTGVPASFEGIFKWVVFLPSINDSERPVPARYFGVYANGTIKARGIEVRQRGSPAIVRYFQQKCLELMGGCSTKAEITRKVPEMFNLLRKVSHQLDKLEPDWLAQSLYLSKTEYERNIPQKAIVESLRSKGVAAMPGQLVSFIMSEKSCVLVEDYNGKPDAEHYKRLLVRSLYVILQPFNISKDLIWEATACERQTKLLEYAAPAIRQIFIPMQKLESNSSNIGLSEKILKRRLEKQGWTVWRGGIINIVRKNDIYPNIRRKYEQLCNLIVKHNPGVLEELQLMCAVHHGMPDFICFRNGSFKFVECKFKNEQLSSRQKKCISKLQQMGFEVEVQKIVAPNTKTRIALTNTVTWDKIIVEKQAKLSRVSHGRQR